MTDELIIRVCECGAVSAWGHLSRCGRDARTNMRTTCPWVAKRVLVTEPLTQEQWHALWINRLERVLP